MIIFNGIAEAKQRQDALRERVALLAKRGKQLKVAALVFQEDSGSLIYTTLKREAAERVGIQYLPKYVSTADELEMLKKELDSWAADETITGIIIQKPTKRVWSEQGREPAAFAAWWQSLVAAIAEQKDVDGLHPRTLVAIQDGSWQQRGKVLPATCAAVLSILELAAEQTQQPLEQSRIAIIGKSDLLGTPLFYELKNRRVAAELLGKKELNVLKEQGGGVKDFSVVVTATGSRNLITGELIAENCILIDVGEPAADVDRVSVGEKPAFITPVPGGVGPMTIVSLLENAVALAK